jgi:hypothetical protein
LIMWKGHILKLCGNIQWKKEESEKSSRFFTSAIW